MDTSPYASFDVWGVALLAHVHAFKQYPTVLEKYFKRIGIGTDPDPVALQTHWVPMDMHHRKDGVVMFDPATSTMLDGIGHYRCEVQEGGTSATMTCDNPYPCDLDRGILAGFAARFEPAVSVSHSSAGCRKKGENACVYLVEW